MGNSSNRYSSDMLKPRGIYPDGIDWDVRTMKKLIQDRKLAPFFEGEIDFLGNDSEQEECPICFLYYTGGLNRSRCCKQGICTECYLKIKPRGVNISCPFCNAEGYSVVFSGPLTQKEIDERIREEEQYQAAQDRAREEERERDKKREAERKIQSELVEQDESSEYLDPDTLAQQGYSPEEIEHMLIDAAIKLSLKS